MYIYRDIFTIILIILHFVFSQGCSRQTPLHVRPSTAGGSTGNCRRALQKCDGVSPQVRSRMHNAKYDTYWYWILCKYDIYWYWMKCKLWYILILSMMQSMKYIDIEYIYIDWQQINHPKCFSILRNYFLSFGFFFLCIIFGFGLCFGRVTNRLQLSHKW